MKVFVLGHKGMLGHVVTAFLREAGHEVLTSDARYTGLPRDPLIGAARDSGCATFPHSSLAPSLLHLTQRTLQR